MNWILDETGLYTGLVLDDTTGYEYFTPIPPDKNYFKAKFDFNEQIWYEGEETSVVEAYKQEIAFNLDKEYTAKISALLSKHIEKSIIESIPIPQEILDERQNLIDEFNQKISELELTTQYRKQ